VDNVEVGDTIEVAVADGKLNATIVEKRKAENVAPIKNGI
jgi:hypothetical protein